MEARVSDNFEIKDRVALEYGATGVVVVLQFDGVIDSPEPGTPVLVMRSDGWMRRATTGEVKSHSQNTRSIFLNGLTQSDVPIGSRLRWGAHLWPDDSTFAREKVAQR